MHGCCWCYYYYYYYCYYYYCFYNKNTSNYYYYCNDFRCCNHSLLLLIYLCIIIVDHLYHWLSTMTITRYAYIQVYLPRLFPNTCPAKCIQTVASLSLSVCYILNANGFRKNTGYIFTNFPPHESLVIDYSWYDIIILSSRCRQKARGHKAINPT